MVLHLGDHDIIARMHLRIAPAIGDQVDPFGCAAHKHQLFWRTSVQECRYLRADIFHTLGRFCAQGMDPAMHGRIAVTVKFHLGVNHLIRLLRTGCAVEIGKRQTVDFTGQDREIRPHFLYRETHALPPGKR
ncbi:hypothetical protein D3C78_1244950 [compost metagenome]